MGAHSAEPPAPAVRNRGFAIAAGCLAVLLGALDTFVVVTIIQQIIEDLGIGLNQIQRVTWIINMYLLGYIAAMPLLGRASDRFGRKLLLQISLAGFAVGSVVTALATEIGGLVDGIIGGDHGLTVIVIGRLIQGAASGALLPVTFALAADLWAQRDRAAVLGAVGGAQELGSVLGPLYGVGVVYFLHQWQYAFWINIPLAAIAMYLVHISLPGRDDSQPKQKIDLTGGLLLAVALGLAVVGMYNPAPDGKALFPSYGIPVLCVAAAAVVAFFVWEWRAKTKLMEPAGVRFLPFFAALGGSLCTGVALMVTLVNVELFGKGVLGETSVVDAAVLLLAFLVALPIGAVVGGFVATAVGDRAVCFVGLLVAAFGYWRIHYWTVDVRSAQYDLGVLQLPTFYVDLAIAGIGLGIVIAPLASATLRAVPPAQHGIASAFVVVARMVGMLIGFSALTAFGLYRFNQNLATLPIEGTSLMERAASIARNVKLAYAMQYGDIFMVTAIVCVVGALFGLLIAGRKQHAEDPEPEVVAAAP